MKKCIICNELKEKNEFSKEHIIPKALNGSLTIDNVCKDCNYFLGQHVDHLITDNFFIEDKKLEYKIKGRRKKLKHPFGKGIIDDGTGREAVFRADEKGNTFIEQYPHVDISGNKLEYNFSKNDSPEKIINIIEKKLTRAGKKPLTEEAKEKIRKDMEKSKKTKPSNLLRTKHEIIMDMNFDPAFVKIAYEIGHFLLGESYFNDAVGKKLRLCLLNADKKNTSEFKIEGKINPLIDKNHPVEKRLKILNRTGTNLIAVFRNNNIILVYIRILNITDGIIIISRTPNDYKPFESDGYIFLFYAEKSKHLIKNVDNSLLSFILEKFPNV